MDNIDNKIMPIEAINIKHNTHRPAVKTTRSIRITGRKRCKRGTRRNKRTHRCRKNKNN